MLSGFQLFIVLFFTWPVLGKESVFERVGGYHTRRPAFLSVLSTGEDKDILISSFDVPKLGNESGGLLSYFSGMNSKNDTIRVIEDFDSFLDNGGHWLDRSGVKSIQLREYKIPLGASDNEKCYSKGKIDWPNLTESVPTQVAGPNILSVAAGFLTPFRDNGNIYLFNAQERTKLVKGKCRSNEINHHISLMDIKGKTNKSQKIWFHKVVWKDMNNDGLLDAITAYAISESKIVGVHPDYEALTDLPRPILGGSSLKGKGYLVWLEQPKSSSWKNPLIDGKGETVFWKEHIISKGPDVNFVMSDIDGDGEEEFLASEFFGDDGEGSLSQVYKGGDGDYHRRVVDNSIGHGFDLSLTDLNNDGNKDILLTNHQGPINEKSKNKFQGRVYGFEIPKDIVVGEFKRHILLDDITVNKNELMQNTEMAPGKAISFYPDLQNKLGKPNILVAGDGASEVYILRPMSDAPANWQYEVVNLYQRYGFEPKKIESVVGYPIVDDINNDGFLDILIPWYEADYIDIWTIK